MLAIKTKKIISIFLTGSIFTIITTSAVIAQNKTNSQPTPQIPKIFSSKKTYKKKSKKKYTIYNLLDVYNLALKNNPQFKINQYALTGPDVAKASLIGAQGSLLPIVGISRSAIASIDQDGNGATALPISLSQTLVNFNSWYTYISKKYTNTAAIELFINTQQGSINQVMAAYFTILTDESLVQQQEQLVKSDQDIYKETNQKYQVGLKPITDVKQTESKYLTDKAELLSKQNNVIADKRALQALIGVYPKHIAHLKETIKYSVPKPNNVNTWIKKAYKISPVLKASQNDYYSAKNAYHASWSDRYLPSLNVLGRYGWANKENTIFQGKLNSGYEASIGLSMSLFDLTKTATAQTAKIASLNSKYLLTQQKRTLRQTISSDFKNIQLYVAQIKAYNEAVLSAQIAYKASLAGYEVGTQTITTVQAQLVTLYEAKSQESGAKFNYILAWLKFKQDLGTLNIKDIVEANNLLIKA